MNSEHSSAHISQGETKQSLKTRNTELQNSNQLLLDELTKYRRIEMALRESMEELKRGEGVLAPHLLLGRGVQQMPGRHGPA